MQPVPAVSGALPAALNASASGGESSGHRLLQFDGHGSGRRGAYDGHGFSHAINAHLNVYLRESCRNAGASATI